MLFKGKRYDKRIYTRTAYCGSGLDGYHQRLHAYIRAQVNTAEDAEDILSRVYLKLAAQIEKGHTIGAMTSWLYAVARNTIADHYRHHKGHGELPQELSHDMQAKQPDESAYKALSQCLLPMIALLPEKYRQVLTLTDIEGEKQQVVADSLGLSLAAVKSRVLRRGREMLHKSLFACCNFFSISEGNCSIWNRNPRKIARHAVTEPRINNFASICSVSRLHE